MAAQVFIVEVGNYIDQQKPRMGTLFTTDSYAVVTAAGYLNSVTQRQFEGGEFIRANYGTNSSTAAIFTVSVSAGIYTLTALSNPGEVSLIGTAVAGNIPKFSGTTGDIADSGAAPSNPALAIFTMFSGTSANNALAVFADAAGTLKPASTTVTTAFGITAATGSFTATLGSLISGNASGGAVGTLQLFATTTTTGSVRWLAAANAGAFNVDFTNASHGQSTVYTFADIGAATGGIPVATAAFKMKQVAQAAVAGGAAAQTVTDAFCTSASNVICNWNDTTNAVSIQKVAAGNGSFVVTSSADPGSSHLNYVIMK